MSAFVSVVAGASFWYRDITAWTTGQQVVTVRPPE
jgi:hypothetical protein